MAVFGRQKPDKLVKWLRRRDLRLFLPADPGPEQLLEYVRLFDPRAELASRGSINVDGVREVYLTQGYAIEPDVAAQVEVPDGMGAVFFATNTPRALPYSWSDVQRKDREQVGALHRLMRGLAIRLGGVSWPDPAEVSEPLRATIYTAREIGAEDVHAIVARYTAGLVPYNNPTFSPCGVSFWRTGDGQFEVSHWPRKASSMLFPHDPRSVGEELYYHPSEQTAVRLELSSPGNQTDPRMARLLGECALEVAAAAQGPCVDQLDFRVLRPDDLVFR